ncbi:HP1 family phage holin [Massilia sp. Leaf139]|uniref:HP1 family phage holin n=1 Tax=Massilia sp. Leaf139 TaxID=1736272 RepID=UPI0006F67FFE|nr:HP1 family phage holin [Massilia sp. Leaf139]KQQ86442.1 hypothetical protein ASF77_20955 [Massilia sp. Leaf139]
MSKSNIPEISSYAGAAGSFGVGALTMNEWACLIGILLGFLTFVMNAWYTKRKDKREQELKDLEKEELISRILAQGRQL